MLKSGAFAAGLKIRTNGLRGQYLLQHLFYVVCLEKKQSGVNCRMKEQNEEKQTSWYRPFHVHG
jgi:hypothetical protein